MGKAWVYSLATGAKEENESYWQCDTLPTYTLSSENNDI